MRRPEIMEPPTRGYTAYRDMLEECLKDAQDMDRVRFTDPPPRLNDHQSPDGHRHPTPHQEEDRVRKEIGRVTSREDPVDQMGRMIITSSPPGPRTEGERTQ